MAEDAERVRGGALEQAVAPPVHRLGDDPLEQPAGDAEALAALELPAPRPQHGRPRGLGARRERAQQHRLADPGFAFYDDDPPTLARPVEGRRQRGELTLAADKWGRGEAVGYIRRRVDRPPPW